MKNGNDSGVGATASGDRESAILYLSFRRPVAAGSGSYKYSFLK